MASLGGADSPGWHNSRGDTLKMSKLGLVTIKIILMINFQKNNDFND